MSSLEEGRDAELFSRILRSIFPGEIRLRKVENRMGDSLAGCRGCEKAARRGAPHGGGWWWMWRDYKWGTMECTRVGVWKLLQELC